MLSEEKLRKMQTNAIHQWNFASQRRDEQQTKYWQGQIDAFADIIDADSADANSSMQAALKVS